MVSRELNFVSGFSETFYWDMKVDDNAFMILKTMLVKKHLLFMFLVLNGKICFFSRFMVKKEN